MSTLFPILSRRGRGTGIGDLWDLHSRMDDLFGELIGPETSINNENETLVFSPRYDITEKDGCYLLSFDMPGVPKDKVKVEVRDHNLYVSGERDHSWKEGKGRSKSTGRFFGRFETVLSLPTGTDSDKVDAHYENGVLHVAVPRTEMSQARQIKIGEGKGSFWSKLLPHKDDKTTTDKSIEIQSGGKAHA